MDIIGTNSAETLTGTESADVINGLGGNDTINALGGNDTINGGDGNDTLSGGDGDDTFVEDTFTTPGDTFNGGAGTDTIELRATPVPFDSTIGPLSVHLLVSPNALISVERMSFASLAGQNVFALVDYANFGAGRVNALIGGAGRDLLGIQVTAAGTYTIPTLSLTNWATAPTNAWEANNDGVSIQANVAAGLAVTLNAASGLNTIQALTGGESNDILNGSANGDILNGGGGTNQLNGGGGNDSLVIANTIAPNGAPGTTFNTGAGSIYDGGAGTDVLSVGGYVPFQGTLQNVEGVFFQPAFTSATAASQPEARLELDAAHLAMLPANAFFQGNGTLVVSLADGAGFNATQYTITAGSAVNFEVFAGVANGITLRGNTGNDYLHFGLGTQTAVGGAGADHFFIGAGVGTVTDFTVGTDKIDFTDTGITSFSRLADFVSQGATGTVFAADTGGQHYEMRLQGVNLSSLTENDVILSTSSDSEFDSTEAADLLFGGTFNDVMHGAGGNDRLYSGGGIDQMYGEAGDDVFIIDGVQQSGGPGLPPALYDGGIGNDTILLRSNSGATINNGLLTSTAFMLTSAPNSFLSIEKIVFESENGEGITGVFGFNDVVNGGVTTVQGGAGRDALVLLITAAGTYTTPNLTYTDWTVGTDGVVLVVPGQVTANVTLNARESLTFTQTLIGGGGSDTLTGTSRVDTLTGNGGNDTLDGGAGGDNLFGGLGNDTYRIDTMADLTYEFDGQGTDTVIAAIDTYLYANVENLTLTGSANLFGVGNEQVNLLTGNDGQNLLIAGAGNDEVHGGGARDAIFGQDGDDALFGDAGIDYIVAGDGNDTIDGGADADEIYGQGGDDTISGGTGFDTDIIVGGDGNDTIYANSSLGDYDLLYGNAGNDSFYVDTPADLVFEQPGEGTDTVYADINGGGYYLYDNIENLVLLGQTPFGVGNTLNNTLTGNDIGNFLLGGDGNDTLNGKGGNDVLFGQVGADTFVFKHGTGGDVVADFVHGTDKIDLRDFGIGSFAQIQTTFVQDGNVGAIILGGGDFIVLHNVTMNTLTADDFILA